MALDCGKIFALGFVPLISLEEGLEDLCKSQKFCTPAHFLTAKKSKQQPKRSSWKRSEKTAGGKSSPATASTKSAGQPETTKQSRLNAAQRAAQLSNQRQKQNLSDKKPSVSRSKTMDKIKIEKLRIQINFINPLLLYQ